jgi:hypothetical protein
METPGFTQTMPTDNKPKKALILYACALLLPILYLSRHYFFTASINSDGVLYLHAANAYLQHGLAASKTFYSWPFYQLLIAFTHRLFHLSLLNSAAFLNYCFLCLSTVVFLKIIRELGGNKTTQWLGLLVIFALGNFYSHHSHQIIRDNGYWSFYLISFWLMLVYLRKPHYLTATAWALMITLATLFRIEGVIFILLAPLIPLFAIHKTHGQHNIIQHKIINCLRLYIAVFIIFSLACLLLFHPMTPAVTTTQASSGQTHDRLNTVLPWLLSMPLTFFHNITLGTVNLAHVINPLGKDSALWGLFSMGIGLYLSLFIYTISWAYTLLTAFTFCRPSWLPFSTHARRCFWGYIAINFFITAAFFLDQNYWLEDRYILAMCLTLALSFPFILTQLYQRFKTRTRHKISWISWFFPLICLLITINVISVLVHFGPSKHYLYQGGRFIKNNTPKNATLYTNLSSLSFLADRKTSGWMCGSAVFATLPEAACFRFKNIGKKPWHGFDYLALKIRSPHNSAITTINRILGRQPIKMYEQSRHQHERFVIWKIAH